VWTARIPVRQVLGEAEPCPRQVPGLEVPAGLKGYSAGRTLEAALVEAYRTTYPE